MIKKTNFISLSHENALLVLKWRNNPYIRQNMHNKDIISIENHLTFINSLKNSSTKSYFLVEINNEKIGVIYLVNEYLGVYSNPQKRKVGDILLKEIIDYAFSIKNLPFIKAEVYKQNTPAINLYKRFGFKTIQDNDNMLTMELKNENS